jgi:hypothetical protein
MSTGQEADALVARAAALGLRVGELASSFDVDEEADLPRLRAALAPAGRAAPATWCAMRRLGLLEGGGDDSHHRASAASTSATRSASSRGEKGLTR